MSELFTKLGIKQAELDEAINIVKPQPTFLLTNSIWQTVPLRTTSVTLEYIDNDSGLIPHTMRTDPPNAKAYEKKSLIHTFTSLHFNLETRISPTDLQDVRQFGTANAAVSNSQIIAEIIKDHRARHDFTHEWYLLGAIKGKLVDKDGDEVEDLFKKFKVNEPKTDFKFSAPTTAIGDLLEPMKRTMRKGLNGDVSNGVTVLCSPEFFDHLISHKSTKEAWQRYQENILAREGVDGKFTYRGIDFILYDYYINNKPMIEAGHAHAFLNGMRRGFVRYNSPANMLDAVNTLAKPFYISLAEADHKRGISIYTESNMIPVCLRPQTLMHLTSS